MRVSPHTARASEKVSLVGIPASPKGLLHVTMDSHDRQNSQRHAERTISPEGGRHLLSLPSSDSITFHVTRDRHGTSVSLRSRECCTRYPAHYSRAFASHAAQAPALRVPPPNPARRQHALRLACLRGSDGTGFPRST